MDRGESEFIASDLLLKSPFVGHLIFSPLFVSRDCIATHEFTYTNTLDCRIPAVRLLFPVFRIDHYLFIGVRGEFIGGSHVCQTVHDLPVCTPFEISKLLLFVDRQVQQGSNSLIEAWV